MRHSLTLLLFTLTLSTLCSCVKPTPDFYLGGIQVNEENQEHWTKSLKHSGYNTVAVTIYAHQGDWDSDNFWFDTENSGVLNEIREAKRQGLQVVLILRVALDHAFKRNQFFWHGMIMPKTDKQLDSWFTKYRNYILAWAKFAEKEGVDILGIGSELNSLTSTKQISEIPDLIEFYLDEDKQTERRLQIVKQFSAENATRLEHRGDIKYENPKQMLTVEAGAQKRWALAMCGGNENSCISHLNIRKATLENFWRSLIIETRKHFSGPLTYAANFDQFHEVSFWDDLDIIGINAYFPLRKSLNVEPIANVLEQAWEAVFTQIESISKDSSSKTKPVIFTELGFTFREHSTLEPWSSEGYSLVHSLDETTQLLFWKEQKIAYAERIAALRALREVTYMHPELLKGILYWKLSTYKPHREIEPFVHILDSEDDAEFDTILRSFLKRDRTDRVDDSTANSFFISKHRHQRHH